MALSGPNFFRESTHSQSLLSAHQIDSIRGEINAQTAERVATVLGNTEAHRWLTVAEEALLRRFYHGKIRDVCLHFNFPKSVQPVAHWLYMRFYLRESLLDFDPKHVMLSCILIATKLENMHLTMADYANKIPNCQPDLILEIELALLEALQFNLHFFHPHQCLAGLHLDLQAAGILQDADALHRLHADAGAWLDRLVTTDALLVETPSRLAWAAYHLANAELTEHWTALRLPDQVASEALVGASKRLAPYAEQAGEPLDTAVLKECDRKLVQARNLFGDVLSMASSRSRSASISSSDMD